MPPRRKEKKVGRKPTATRTPTKTSTERAHTEKNPGSESARAPIPSDATGHFLRPRPPFPKAQTPKEKPKPIRSKPTSREVKQSARRPGTPARGIAPLERIVKSVEAPLQERYRHIDHKSTDEETSPDLQDTDLQKTFFRAWGYLPPLDEEGVALIEAIMENPTVAKETSKLINPQSRDFIKGLQNRNVLLEETPDSDSYAKHIENLNPDELLEESDDEETSHKLLWDKDLEKCTQGSNEALFQRTIMMFLIARHCLIYRLYKIDGKDKQCLDFSVEEPWICPPMPTRAYEKMNKFLTQPKPDLAVCFVRDAVISNYLWNDMPESTQKLACYENPPVIGRERVFHFCTIEAKKSFLSPDDITARNQSLNNASQALHNMFEFFQDAGEDHKEIFFAQVRFFSVVASTEGLTIRIHRAVRDSGTEEGFILPSYTLRFEHQEFTRVLKSNFDRKQILETFAKIFIGYGVNVLRLLLDAAAKALMSKLRSDRQAKELRQDADFYRHGQTKMLPSSRKSTPAVQTQSFSAANISFMSVDTNRSQTKTPGPGESFTASGTGKNKRRRNA